MKYSYRWLQSYFGKPLPVPEELARLITFHLAEVEGVEATEGDTLLEVKILPDRSHDCLGHRGLAREIGALINDSILFPEKSELRISPEVPRVPLEITDPRDVYRALSQVVTNVKAAASPAWLVERLAALGQRSINNIVDATNFLMFDVGQPVHAFDFSKVKGSVVIRRARSGEKLMTLDDREIVLDESMLVIADDEGPLDLAGVKGGKRAGITSYTHSLLLTACTFNATLVRQAAKNVGLQTDAAKRFSQGLSPALAATAIDELVLLILSFGNENVIGLGARADEYPAPWRPSEIRLVPRDVNDRLGIKLETEEIKKILERLNFKVLAGESGLAVTAPPERLDVNLREDVIEEVARIYGYHRLPSKNLRPAQTPINHDFNILMAVKTFFATRGFTENYGYTFAVAGEVALENPLSSDKVYLRTDLTTGLAASLKFNRKHLLFDTEVVRIFEVGNVFTSRTETTQLAFGLSYQKAKVKNAEADEVLAALWNFLGVSAQPVQRKDEPDSVIIELDWGKLAALVTTVPTLASDDFIKSDLKFKAYSPYPRIVRDVALFVPIDTSAEQVEQEIRELVQDAAGGLLTAGPTLFDTFEKANKKSLAFRLVFQAFDRTLTDDEVNEMMKVTGPLAKERGWELR